jgi:hypothetical protein
MATAVFSICAGSLGVVAAGLQTLWDIIHHTLHPYEIFVGLALMAMYAMIFIWWLGIELIKIEKEDKKLKLLKLPLNAGKKEKK